MQILIKQHDIHSSPTRITNCCMSKTYHQIYKLQQEIYTICVIIFFLEQLRILRTKAIIFFPLIKDALVHPMVSSVTKQAPKYLSLVFTEVICLVLWLPYRRFQFEPLQSKTFTFIQSSIRFSKNMYYITCMCLCQLSHVL